MPFCRQDKGVYKGYNKGLEVWQAPPPLLQQACHPADRAIACLNGGCEKAREKIGDCQGCPR